MSSRRQTENPTVRASHAPSPSLLSRKACRREQIADLPALQFLELFSSVLDHRIVDDPASLVERLVLADWVRSPTAA